MKNSLQEKLSLRGDLQVEIRDAKTDKLLKRYSLRNQITYNGINSPIFLWSQDGITVTDYRIVTLAAGSGGVPPTKGDVALNAPITNGTIALTSSNRTQSPATGELIITAQWAAPSVIDGNTLVEAGLFLGNNTLFARQIHPSILKTSAITVSYSWRIAGDA